MKRKEGKSVYSLPKRNEMGKEDRSEEEERRMGMIDEKRRRV